MENGGQDSMFENRTDEQNLNFATGGSPRADVLIRPFPHATGGIPASLSFDPTTKAMNYVFETRTSLANQTTEIFVPVDHHYGGHYCADVTGPAVKTSGYWIDELGWTGVGENWEEGSRSRNHHMQGSIGRWMVEELAGSRRASRGSRSGPSRRPGSSGSSPPTRPFAERSRPRGGTVRADSSST